MDGVTSSPTAKESDSGYMAKTYGSACAFGRKIAPLVAGCVIGLLLATVYPLIAGLLLWQGRCGRGI